MAAGIVASRDGGRTRHLAVQDHSQAHRQNGTATESKTFAKLRRSIQLAARIHPSQIHCNPMRVARELPRYLEVCCKFRCGGASSSHRAAAEDCLHA